MSEEKTGQSYNKPIAIDSDSEDKSSDSTWDPPSQLQVITAARKRDYSSDETMPSCASDPKKQKQNIEPSYTPDKKPAAINIRTSITNHTDSISEQKPPAITACSSEKDPIDNDSAKKSTSKTISPTKQTNNNTHRNSNQKPLQVKLPYVKHIQSLQPSTDTTKPLYAIHELPVKSNNDCRLRLIRTREYWELSNNMGLYTTSANVKMFRSGHRLIEINDKLSYLAGDLDLLEDSYPMIYELLLNKIRNNDLLVSSHTKSKFSLLQYIGRRYTVFTFSRCIRRQQIVQKDQIGTPHWRKEDWESLRKHINDCFVTWYKKHCYARIMCRFSSTAQRGEWFEAFEQTIDYATHFVKVMWKMLMRLQSERKNIPMAMTLTQQWAETLSAEWEHVISVTYVDVQQPSNDTNDTT